MSSSDDNKRSFEAILRQSLTDGTFRRATLSNPASGVGWKRVAINLFQSPSKEPQVAFHYDSGTKVERKNHSPQMAGDELCSLVPNLFRSANVRLEGEEILFEQTPQHTFRLKRRATEEETQIAQHNREKNHIVSSEAEFLFELGITSKDGAVRRDRYDKFRQINKFVEVISSLIPQARLSDPQGLMAVDYGSGKHYLTFALHEYLTKQSFASRVVGIERRTDLVTLGQGLAEKLECRSLSFQEGTIASSEISSADLVVALHACDTATDDALVKAVSVGAGFICVAPCCHKYVRQQFKSSPDLAPLLRHGILEERFTESLTDSLRVLALEALGYRVKLFEFISLEHTAKNSMITAVKCGGENAQSLRALQELRDKFSLSDFYLDRQLGLS